MGSGGHVGNQPQRSDEVLLPYQLSILITLRGKAKYTKTLKSLVNILRKIFLPHIERPQLLLWLGV